MPPRRSDRFRDALVLGILTPLIALGSSTTAAAATAKGALPPDMVAYFAGNWTGSGAFAKSGKPLASDYSFAPDIENQCLVVHQKEKPPNDFEFVALWSVNSNTGELVMPAGQQSRKWRQRPSRQWMAGGQALIRDRTGRSENFRPGAIHVLS